MTACDPGEVIVSLKNVDILYKKRGRLFSRSQYFQALKDVSLDIYRGETLGIVGRNGAGKSTLLKVIAGILQPNRGTITNHGVSVSLLALQTGFDIELSGEENAIMSGMLLGYSRKQMVDKIPGITEFSELGEFMNEPIKTYSSGMRARLGFSVAMYSNPDVLLLDEVLAVGDKEFREKAEKTMSQRIFSDQTVVMVSHSEEQIERFCDRKIVL